MTAAAEGVRVRPATARDVVLDGAGALEEAAGLLASVLQERP
jgi:hypothetical protein